MSKEKEEQEGLTEEQIQALKEFINDRFSRKE